jgi:hypothetical protein
MFQQNLLHAGRMTTLDVNSPVPSILLFAKVDADCTIDEHLTANY